MSFDKRFDPKLNNSNMIDLIHSLRIARDGPIGTRLAFEWSYRDNAQPVNDSTGSKNKGINAAGRIKDKPLEKGKGNKGRE